MDLKIEKSLSIEELNEIEKINESIRAEEQEMDKYYYELGKQYILTYGLDGDTAFADIFEKIRCFQKEIEEYNKQILAIKGIVKCTSCGSEVTIGSRFCNYCGSPIESAEAESNMQKCSNCGALMPKHMKFCGNCGCSFNHTTSLPITPADNKEPAVNENQTTPVSGNPIIIDNIGNVLVNQQPPVDQPVTDDIKTICSHCGQSVPSNVAFCISCGKKLDIEQIEVQDETKVEKPKKVCRACGKELSETMAFCIYCGTAVN